MADPGNLDHDHQTPVGDKKKLNLALLDLAERGWTANEDLGNVMLARRINMILGGAFVAPWNVQDLPDATVEVILSIERLGEIKAGHQKVQGILQAWKNKHPGYQRRQ